jgi:hypothetical protein
MITRLALWVTTSAVVLSFAAVIAATAYQMPKHAIAALCIAGFFAFAAAICAYDLE